MKILVTGSEGFIGKNLIAQLENLQAGEILKVDKDTDPLLLQKYCRECQFVYHLAGVNRPQDPAEFHQGNFGFTSQLLELLKSYGNRCPVMLASSIQAKLDNPYGISKRKGEELLQAYGKENQVPVYIYRFPNVFGKWCRPNYNSAVATFCYNIAHDLPIQVNGRDTRLQLVYIDDVVESLIRLLDGKEEHNAEGYCMVPVVHSVTLGEIVDLLESFRESRHTRMIPDMAEGSFSKKLYSTYLSYLPEDQFKYPLEMHVDQRGSFTEILRTAERGQFSVNISKPGIERKSLA